MTFNPPDTQVSGETAQKTAHTFHLDERWVAALKNMDAQAWEMLLQVYADELRNGIQASLGKRGLSPSLADDIEQETWLTAVQKIGEFRSEDVDKLFRWLRAISLNHVYTYARQSRRYVSIDDQTDEDIENSLERFYQVYGLTRRAIEDAIAWQEQLIAIDLAMSDLRPQEREIFTRWLMGETPKQLAAVYPLKPRSISMLLLRAKEKIEGNLLLRLLQHKDDDHA